MQKQLKRFKIQCWESTIYSFNNWNESYNQRRVVVWLIEVVEFEPFSKFLDTVSICRTSLDEKKFGDGHVLITFCMFVLQSFHFCFLVGPYSQVWNPLQLRVEMFGLAAAEDKN